jgi:O-antigen/teichoic acid export membrane protein
MSRQEFENDIGTMARGTSLAGFGNVTKTFSGFMIVALQVRYLNLDKYGAFAIAFGLAILLTVPARMGLDSGVNHFLVKARINKSPRDLWGIFWIVVVIPFLAGIVLMSAFLKCIPLINSQFYQSIYFSQAMTVFTFGLPLLAVADLPVTMTRCFETNRYFVLGNNIIGQGIEVLLLLGLWLLQFNWIPKASISMVVGVRLVSRIAVLVVGLYGFSSLAHTRRLAPAGFYGHVSAAVRYIKQFKQVLMYSAPLLLSNVFLRVMQWTDTIILGAFLDTTAAGAYRVAVQLAMALMGVLMSVGSILGPMIARFHHLGQHEKIIPLYIQAVRLSTLGVLPFVVSMAIFPDQFLMLFESGATIASTALVLLVFAQLFNTFTGNVGTILTMAGKPHWHAINGLVVTFGQFVLCLFLVPRLGINGAALATLTTIILLNWLRFLETKWFFGLYSVCRQTLEPFVPAIIAGLFLVIINLLGLQSFQNHYMLLIMLSLFISLLIIWGLHALFFIRSEEREFLNAIWLRIKSTGFFMRLLCRKV